MLESSHPKDSQRRRAARRRSPAPLGERPDATEPASGWQRPSTPKSAQRRVSNQSDAPSQPEPIRPWSGQRPAPQPLDRQRSGKPRQEKQKRQERRQGKPQPAAASRAIVAQTELAESTGTLPKQRRGVANQPPQRSRQFREKRDRRPASPLLHLVRLLILGVGVGAIAGTSLSIWNPAVHPSAAAQQASSAALGNVGDLGLRRSNATVLLAKGQQLTGLTPKIAPLTQGLTDLTPGAFLVDLDTGDSFSLNGESSFPAASMIKVPILVALLQDVDEGRIRLDEKLVLQQADMAEGSGDMQYLPIGSDYTVLQTITNMIIISDNTATNMVIRRLGGIEVLNQRFRQWGLQQTVLRNLLPDLAGTNITSPKELSLLMTMVSQGDLLSMKSRDRALDIMRRTVTATLLPTSLGEDATISHKTGDIGSLVGDTGIIDMPNGKRYAITLMVKRPHNDERAQDLIRQISAAVYDYMNQASGSRPSASPEASPVDPSPSGAPEGATSSDSSPDNLADPASPQ